MVLTVGIRPGVPDPVDELIVAVEIALVRSQVLGRSRREVDGEALERDGTRSVVDEAQIPKSTARMVPIYRVGAWSLAHGEESDFTKLAAALLKEGKRKRGKKKMLAKVDRY